jgi:phosphate:Na+ symporter
VNAAAAAVIGANVGTTSTAVIAALQATPNAKRVAVGHVAFNVITAIIALALLPFVIWFVSVAGHWIGIKDQPALFLAFFHTIFNMLGVALLAPFATKLAKYLETKFRTQEESISSPQYFDKTVINTPVLALAALWKELQRLYELSCKRALFALEKNHAFEKKVKAQSEAIYSLGKSIDEFTTGVRIESMEKEQAEELPVSLRAARHLEEVAHLTLNLHTLSVHVDHIPRYHIQNVLSCFLSTVQNSISAFSLSNTEEHLQNNLLKTLEKFQISYQETKAELLKAAAEKHLPIEDVDELIDELSRTRRLIEQLAQANHISHAKKNGVEGSK